MNCPACNADVAENSVFCPKCGERLNEAATVGARITSGGGQPLTAADRFKEQLTRPAASAANDDAETELWTGGFSPKAMLGSWLASGVLTVLLLVGLFFFFAMIPAVIAIVVLIALVWLWPVCVLAYRRLAIRYRLTSQRFVHEHGILSRGTDRIEVIDIDDVSFNQSLIDRFAGVGTITITSGDKTHPVLKLIGIDDVKRVYDLIDNARRKERVRRGIHIASAGDRGGGL
jgi:membrane protein YdbS with pleckstrin-like domain